MRECLDHRALSNRCEKHEDEEEHRRPLAVKCHNGQHKCWMSNHQLFCTRTGVEHLLEEGAEFKLRTGNWHTGGMSTARNKNNTCHKDNKDADQCLDAHGHIEYLLQL